MEYQVYYRENIEVCKNKKEAEAKLKEYENENTAYGMIIPDGYYFIEKV